MSYNINGINLSYDYNDLISEIEEDLEDKIIDTSTIIVIVRSKDNIAEGVNYKAIIDYYYPDDYISLTQPIENFCNKDEFTEDEWEALDRKRMAMFTQYKEDEALFERASALAVLTEMKEWNKFI